VSLSLEYERCVRPRAVTASCQACVDVCPTLAVTLEGPKRSVAISLDACTSCGLCEAVCPTSALRGAVDAAAYLARAGAVVSCGDEGLPCVGALSVEALLTLGLSAARTIVAKAGCAHGSTGHRAQKVAEANALLRAMNVGHPLTWTEEGPPAPRLEVAPPPPAAVPARRQFIGLFVPRAVPASPVRVTQPERLDVKALRAAVVPERRKQLMAVLPNAVSPTTAKLPGESISFASSKVIDEKTCTGCLACVTACPTGALTASRMRETIRFDASRCVKCHLCHDVCEPSAITLAEAFEVTGFLDFAPRPLVTLAMRPCSECGAPYKSDGHAMCPTCRGHDDEARELWGRR
jgi:ferredoxin